MGQHLEIERTFSPQVDAQLPALTSLPGVDGVSEAETWRLDATYFDTDGLALTRAGISLRRRTGGTDEGWHLKVPAAVGRHEQRVPLARSQSLPPAVLRRTVLGRTRGAALAPVARIQTTRTVRRLLAADGTVLAEVADDVVLAESLTPGAVGVSWREWEVELVTGDLALLEASQELFALAGVPLSEVQRKVELALAERLAEPDVGAEDQVEMEPSAEAPARVLLQPRFRDQVEELLRQDLRTRTGSESGVHQMRVAGRRLRSALATFAPLLDRAAVDRLREELRWFMTTLSDARDAQVAYELLAPLVELEGERHDVGVLRRQVGSARRVAARRSSAETIALLGTDRYLALLDDLVALGDAAPWRPRAERSASKVVLPRISGDLKRLRERHDRAEALAEAGDREGHERAVHDVRKAAKRLRYACEAAEPVWAEDAARLRRAAKQVTELLGMRLDTVLTRAELERLAAQAEGAGESAFLHGRLHALEECHADQLIADYRAYWPELERRRLGKWLR